MQALIRRVGSLGFAALLMLLAMLALGAATVFESVHGAEQALAVFYGSPWFILLLGLLGLNVTAALVVRYPFSRKQAGFVVTHVGILVTLVGAAVTQRCGVDGRVAIVEGEDANAFEVNEEVLSVVRADGKAHAAADLGAVTGPTVRGPVDGPAVPELVVDTVNVKVERYLPDSQLVTEVRNNAPHPRLAIEVAFSHRAHGHGPHRSAAQHGPSRQWLFPGQPTTLGGVRAVLRTVRDAAAWRRLRDNPSASRPTADGVVEVTVGGTRHELPLRACLARPQAVGKSGYRLRVLRYLPHATVGTNNAITNASERPINPAIEAKLIGPKGPERRLAFARFPEFATMHRGRSRYPVRITFRAPGAANRPLAPIEVLAGPEGALEVRFSRHGRHLAPRPLRIGQPLSTPWHGAQLTLLRRYERARLDRSVKAIVPPRKTRVPALVLAVSTPQHQGRVTLQKHHAQRMTIGGRSYELAYAERTVPLGFTLRLERFRVGTYPGTRRPRSFTSLVTITDAASGRSEQRTVSMNSPISYGDYTLFQSSYQLGRGRAMSVLSVSRDPGQPLAFGGYLLMICGMALVIGTRAAARNHKAAKADEGPAKAADPPPAGPPAAEDEVDRWAE